MTIPYEAALDDRPDNECKHGMIAAYCAYCLGHKDADEEEDEIGLKMVSNLLRFNTQKRKREM